jgi:ribonucleotide reductase alpha subunit
MKINVPVATTCVKPSGTVSQLVDSASGVHPRYSQYYIRRYRISSRDPLFRLMRDAGIKCNPEVGQDKSTASTWVLEFPVKSPDGCMTRKDVTALEQLKHYKNLQHNWCEHNASMTVYVRDDEWFEVGNWVYQNWDIINGVSFLPYDGGKYELAPYEEIDHRTYERLIKTLPLINYTDLSKYELEDNTQGKAEYACVGDRCEI